jgi:deaminated glutathione amidase
MQIALAQLEVSADKRANLDRMLDMTSAAARAGAELVVFPEHAMANADPTTGPAGLAEPIDGPFVQALVAAARRHGIAIVAGVLESTPSGERAYNAAVAIGPDGDMLGSYRKIHLYDAFGYRESTAHEPGSGDLLVFTLGGVRFGVAICYDLRFPELFRELVAHGAQAILLPTNWAGGVLKEFHWRTLVCARAIENTVFVAAADQVGGVSAGCSMLVDPMGVVVASAGETETLVTGAIDADRIEAVRRKLPSLQHMRPDIYRHWQLAEARR